MVRLLKSRRNIKKNDEISKADADKWLKTVKKQPSGVHGLLRLWKRERRSPECSHARGTKAIREGNKTPPAEKGLE